MSDRNLVGMYANFWFLDSAGGLVLSIYVMGNWARTAKEHIAHLTGSAASVDERSVLLYLVMRFAKCIRWIQNLEAYHSGDRLNVEVDVVLDESTTLHDSHDVGESLQHMLESVSTVDRAFVHLDYASYNLPTHIGHDTR
jgi:divalent metal cation (Fe/Co/Zn/Cd) transporter